MTRKGLALLLLCTAAGAGAAPQLPVPPVPPQHPPDQTAPIPNQDARAPRDPGTAGTQVQITDFRSPRLNQSSLGYAPGSHFQSSNERRDIDTPGLTVRVPLQ
jgi:hypothetical protein